MMTKEKWERVCPRCGSKDIVTDDKAGFFKLGSALPIYNCRKCGLRGPLFPEDKVDPKKKK